MSLPRGRAPSQRVSETSMRSATGSDPEFLISKDDRLLLLKWSRSRTLAARVVLRSRIVLMLAEGGRVKAIAQELRISAATVRLWRQRFRERGPAGLQQDAQGRGRKPALDASVREALRTAAGNSLSVRARARELGVSAATVSRWRRRRSG
jgi:transposase